MILALNAEMMKMHRDNALSPEGKRKKLDELTAENNCLLKENMQYAEAAQKERK
ncbi:MAG TPA: hypothetical protein PKL28_04370 [Rhodocyclaceae bacterium]|nr:hypothetical protein [Rhodocyclaceae bacterium]HMZ55447.1 hypothetical protein [Nitrospira sp.]HNM80263.1 hypothetical protein [Rhodocyclaceae bacterium]